MQTKNEEKKINKNQFSKELIVLLPKNNDLLYMYYWLKNVTIPTARTVNMAAADTVSTKPVTDSLEVV